MKSGGVNLVLLTFVLLGSLSIVSATCNLQATLLNQDPYPAIPGDYVKVVFQVDGAQNSECGNVKFGIKEQYPFSLAPGEINEHILNSEGYSSDPNLRTYGQFKLIAYKLRVDKDAFEGDNTLTTYMIPRGLSANSSLLRDFSINIDDTQTDFEVNVKDYDFATKEIIFELLNIGKENIEALTVEIPVQEGVNVIGANRVILGDLNSNEEDSVKMVGDFEEGEITLRILYTDSINERRTLEKQVTFNPNYFNQHVGEKKGISAFWAFIVGLAIPIVWMYWKKRKAKKKLHHATTHQHTEHKHRR